MIVIVLGGIEAVKHSVVRLVWFWGEYGALAAGVYSARKQ